MRTATYKICEQCAINFKVKDLSKPNRFCSKKCYFLNRTDNIIIKQPTYIDHASCIICNNIFKPKTNRGIKVCSGKCQSYYYYQKSIMSKEKNIKCIECHKYFVEHKNQLFCSRICYWHYRKSHPNIIFQSNQVSMRIDIKCINCSSIFLVHQYRKRIASFCSTKCKFEYKRELIKCPTCTLFFSAAKHRKRRYCNAECYAKGTDKRRSKFSIDVLNNLKKLMFNSDIDCEVKVLIDGKLCFADFIIDNTICIECQGDYWHCNPIIYNSAYFHSKLKKYAFEIWNKDKERILFLEKCGYIVIELWECEWRHSKNYQETLETIIRKYDYEIFKGKLSKISSI